MNRLYKKNELWFALLWIIGYCLIFAPIRGHFGDESGVMTAALALISAGIFAFIKINHLEEKYGLCRYTGRARDYLYFIPMIILSTGNLWGGLGIAYGGAAQVFSVISMLLIGFVEEMIFRGFLFRALLKKGSPTSAVIISAVTFGIGHIVNLFAGQASLETVVQIFFAIAWGFIFTLVFYKSGSLVICIIVHSLIDAFSKFSAPDKNVVFDYVYISATIIGAAVYCLYLNRRPAALTDSPNQNGAEA